MRDVADLAGATAARPSPAVSNPKPAVVDRSHLELGTVDARGHVMRDLHIIDTAELTSVTGGLWHPTTLQTPPMIPTMPRLPDWLLGKPFKIPAADPPGHTRERLQMQEQQQQR